MPVITFTVESVVAALPAPENLDAPVLAGQSIEPGRVGDALDVTTGDWANGPETFTYAWYRRDTAGGSKTTIGTESTFTLAVGQVDKYVGCDVTATNDTGSATAQSNQIGPVAPQVPLVTVLPVITGTLQVGETLSVSDGTWDNSPSGYTYQWYSRPSSIGTKTNLGTASTQALSAGHVDLYIGCDVTATNTGGSRTESAATVGPITAAGSLPVNTVAPSISGTAASGQTLTIGNGTWTGNPTPTYTYQWNKTTPITVNGTAVTVDAETVYGGKANMGTASTQALAQTDVGSVVGCSVTGTNTLGSATADAPVTAEVSGTVTYNDTYLAPAISEESGATDELVHTFTDFDIGTANADRVVTFFVVVQGVASAIASVSVNGSTSGVVKHTEIPPDNSAVKMAAYSKALSSGVTADIVVTFQIATKRCAILGYAHTRGTNPNIATDTTYTPTGSGILDGTITVPASGALMACACSSSAAAASWAFSYNGTVFANEDYDATLINTIKAGLGRHTTAGTNQTVRAVCSNTGATPARLIALAFGARN